MCLYPITMVVKRKVTGKHELVTFSCGKCLECVTKNSTEWAFRLYLEARSHKEVCFVTLTYNEDNLPLNGNLDRREVQLFIKKLRKAISPVKIRIFYSGEYGSKKDRCHFHIIVFGFIPKDLVFFFKRDGHNVYKSDFISSLWSNRFFDKEKNKYVNKSKGFITVEDLTLDSAKYCAKYMQKLKKPPKGNNKPFIGMSNRPGIGYYAIDLKYLDTDCIWINGKSIQIPRYFLKVLERAGLDLTEFHNKRLAKAELYGNNLEARRKKAQEFLKSSKIFLDS